MKAYDVVIIGGGAAGLSAAVYATRYNMKTLLIAKNPGQITEAAEIENYPGFLRIKGMELSSRFREHAELLGCESRFFTEVKGIKKAEDGFEILTDQGDRVAAKSVIIATGSRKKRLDIPGERKLSGKGVSYCVTCDAPFFRGKTVAVAGGGDAALMGALQLAEHTNKVFLIYRRMKRDMKAMPSWVTRAEKTRKIEFIFNAVVTEVMGDGKVEKIMLGKGVYKNKTFEIDELEVDGLFVEVGSIPENEIPIKLGVETDANGFVKVGPDMSTSVKGVFAAGDITNGSAGFEQIITAAAEGALAARSAYTHVVSRRK